MVGSWMTSPNLSTDSTSIGRVVGYCRGRQPSRQNPEGRDDGQNSDNKAKPKTIPLSVWPTVLQRSANEGVVQDRRDILGEPGRFCVNFGCLYYLLRHGPVLCERALDTKEDEHGPNKTRKVAPPTAARSGVSKQGRRKK